MYTMHAKHYYISSYICFIALLLYIAVHIDLQLLTSSGANSAREPRTSRRESLLLSTRACSLSTVCTVAFLKKAK